MALQIATGVDKDKGTDAGDQQREHQAETIHHEVEIDTQAGNPFMAQHHGLTRGNLGPETQKVAKQGGRQHRQAPADFRPQNRRQARYQRR